MSALPPLADMLENPCENNAAIFEKSLRCNGFLHGVTPLP